MANKNQHVIPHNGKWAVKREGNSRLTSIHETKQEAIDAARKITRNHSGRLYIHGRSGQILLEAKASSKIRDDRIRQAVREGSPQLTRVAKAKAKKTSSKESTRSASLQSIRGESAKKSGGKVGPTRGR